MSRISLRRLRQDEHIRALTRGPRPHPEQFIQPLFVVEGIKAREPIPGLTGVYRDTPASLLAQIESDLAAGVSKFLLFGVPATHQEKDIDWSFTAGQIAAIKQRFGSRVWLAVDVCLCSATPHGHCGVLNDSADHLDNVASVRELAAAALAYAKAGADCVAPSDMMDGRIGTIRQALEAEKHIYTRIMAYSAKYASAFYGPFRDAVGSAANLGKSNKFTYQMDPANRNEALREVAADIREGADMVMVKPGLPYLDILRDVKNAFGMPTYAYQVSGEYAMIKAAAANGWLDHDKVMMESLLAFKRAGGDGILTYFAIAAAKLLKDQG